MMATYLYAIGATTAYCLFSRDYPKGGRVLLALAVLGWPIFVPLFTLLLLFGIVEATKP